jgi:hypothetical protein
MTYKDIESSRNARLWITEVIMPVTTLAVTALIMLPDVRHAMGDKVVQIKNSIKNTFKKESGKTSNRVIIRIDAQNRDEALGALEAIAKEVFETPNNDIAIRKVVRTKGRRKV